MDHEQIKQIAGRLTGTSSKTPNPRAKAIIDRLVLDLMIVIEDFDIEPKEFWAAISQLAAFGVSNEFGLLVAGLGLEHYFDLREDEKELKSGMDSTGTPRTIEGPLYIAGAPVCEGEARLDDGTDLAEILFMDGQVKDTEGNLIPGAKVEVWHCNSMGNYSFFDRSQSDFNLRRTIIADSQGKYRFQSIMPSGYGVPPDGETQKVLDLLGRHGKRPAHIHFMVSASGYRLLTTQINIEGDEYLNDDFAFATREELIPKLVHHTAPEELAARGLSRSFATISFDFTLPRNVEGLRTGLVERPRAHAA